MSWCVRLFCLITAAVVLSPPAARAQTGTTASIRGRVLDPMRVAVAGARVEALPAEPTPAPVPAAASLPVATTATDSDGRFELHLPTGRYRLRVQANGFPDVERLVTSSASAAGEAPSIDVVLHVPGLQEAVTVTAALDPAALTTTTATKTPTPLLDVPQSVTIVDARQIRDQMMTSVGDVLRYVPGVSVHQGENNRDQIILRGNSSSADFFVDGVRDDVQYYRDLYNLARIETLKGPNAMIFGRGGAGGVVNRVSKTADFGPARELSLQTGAFGTKRLTGGVNQPLGMRAAVRVDAMYEQAGSFRDHVSLERGGLTPTATLVLTPRTTATLRYEHLRDRRTADRGITSFQGRPAAVARSTFYGNPDASYVHADVNLASATLEHRRGRFTVRTHTLAGLYERSYQNFVPGAVSVDGTQVALTAYNNATDRTNVFNQTDLIATAGTGRVRQTLLVGTEFGRQVTDNLRNTGFFGNTAPSLLVPFTNPVTAAPITFRQSATDADNHVTTRVAAAYVQDQVTLTRHLQLLGGLRLDRFDLTYHNNRTGDTLARPDTLVSPRAGVVVKPIPAASLYASYGVSSLPSAGDQFSSLTAITQQVKPEQFRNYEAGAKWDVRPALSLTTAVYRLDRTNTRSTDPNDPTRIVQTGCQRTNGYELGVNGTLARRWIVTGGYAWQEAFVRTATTAAAAGAHVAQVPHHTLSFWNRYQIHPRVAGALGVLRRTEMFAAIDNTVRLLGYTRVDAAGYVTLSRALRLQVNVENLLDARYIVNADSNTNLSPGVPRAVRVGLVATFR